jgi:hypothetical protein
VKKERWEMNEFWGFFISSTYHFFN